MSIRVVDHYPDINQIGVPRNAEVKIVFSSGIVPQSITESTFSVNASDTFSSHPGTLGIEYTDTGVPTTAVFQPTINFTANKKYTAYVYGRPNSVISEENEMLENAYMFEFTAGTGVLVDAFPEGIPSGDLPVSGWDDDTGLVVLSGDAAHVYSVLEHEPQNMEPNVTTTLSGYTLSSIAVTFSGEITSTLAELSGLVAIEDTPVLQ